MYTLMREAHEAGLPAVRALVLEYPTDPVTWDKATQYEFLLGKSFLVAPVWKDEEKRDSIYLPAGKWIDYWDGTVYDGGRWISNYSAPLDRLPLFVKSGSIIPMYPQMNYDGEKPLDTLSLDIYPGGRTTYRLYEDDGLTRDYKKGVYAITTISSVQRAGVTSVIISPVKGSYKGILPERSYVLYVHGAKKPSDVTVDGKPVKSWHYDAADRKGVVAINCGKWDITKKIMVRLK
jgi:alpha-glucosidase (family GH31 glycosyl hydrolase)